MTQSPQYVVATIRPWNIEEFHRTLVQFSGTWHLLSDGNELNAETLARIDPRYIFFPHWSHKVPQEILSKYECVCFHETDVPYGRGGSPLQNLISNGHQETKITALRMSDEIDAGPVYAKRSLSLHGLAEEIYIRAAGIISEMIHEIIENEPEPCPQEGEAVYFKRRSPSQSEIPAHLDSLQALFDFIRMLDAREYPSAYLEYNGFQFYFEKPALRTDAIEASVTIQKKH